MERADDELEEVLFVIDDEELTISENKIFFDRYFYNSDKCTAEEEEDKEEGEEITFGPFVLASCGQSKWLIHDYRVAA